MPDDAPTARQALFEQLKAVFAMHGKPLPAETCEWMQPLLDGSLGYDEHRAMLASLLEDARHG